LKASTELAFNNTLGAFADGAILFPLIAALSLQGALPVDRLLFTAGLAYIVSGFIFKIPMPVQPLKSIAIAAVAVHASGFEIRASGAILGIVCLVLALFIKQARVSEWVRSIPPFFIRALQTALGVLLAMQGIKILFPLPLFEKVASLAVLALLFLVSSLPLLGLVATIGLIIGVYLNWHAGTQAGTALASVTSAGELFRPAIIASLVIPQIVLTFANSVLSTKDVAKHYYGEAANQVTEERLLTSIGFGNLVVASLSGLPYCHGAGGLTAHFRGGAKTYHANFIIGGTLVLFGLITHFGDSVVLRYPLFLLGALLIATGWFHFGLVRTKRVAGENWKLAVVGMVAAFTQAMTWPLVFTVAICCLPFAKKGPVHDFVR
jgi:SulP family sulfate permease